jgi:23S rRNA pseudouridine1911/1915/1917 synthase
VPAFWRWVLGSRLNVDVLYSDESLLAVAKPAGMVVHPTYKNKTGTLLDAVTSAAVPRPSIVGRLDKWTSGIVLVAKSSHVHAALQRSLALPSAEKVYFAIIIGRPPASSGAVDLPLKVDPADRRRVIAAPDGAPSLTHFELIASRDVGRCCLSVLRCTPATGRRHQIRVHLAEIGLPLLGDVVYGKGMRIDCGDPVVQTAIDRLHGQALHSWKVSFDHPVTGRRISVEAPITGTMAALLGVFGF